MNAAASVLLMIGAGCAKTPVQAAPEPPPALEVPVAPPRVLAPAVEPEPEPTLPEKEPRPEPARTPNRPRTTPRGGTGAGEPRPDPGRPETLTPATETPGTAASDPARPSADAPGLRTPQTANDVEAERRVRDVLARAARDLERVDRRSLGADARGQFDTARRFIDQASEALKARNYMFAAYLADKAEALARGLAGR